MTDDGAPTSLVMVTGSGPGVGKTTLVGGVQKARALSGQETFVVHEDWLFDWPRYSDLARMFKEKNFPTADDLLAAFSDLDGQVPPGALWIQDWSWIDLAEDLPWATDPDVLSDYSLRLLAAARHRNPLVVYLSLDPAVGVDRRVHQYGAEWFSTSLDQAAVMYATREPRLLAAIAAGSWPTHTIAASREVEDVLRDALARINGGR
jgi:hypothetical protein